MVSVKQSVPTPFTDVGTLCYVTLHKPKFPLFRIVELSKYIFPREAQEALQWLNKNDRAWLERFKAGLPANEIDKMQQDLANIIRLFDHSLVLNYQNGEIWYNVSPLVREHV